MPRSSSCRQGHPYALSPPSLGQTRKRGSILLPSCLNLVAYTGYGCGQLAERLKVLDSKSSRPFLGLGGSNPSLPANGSRIVTHMSVFGVNVVERVFVNGTSAGLARRRSLKKRSLLKVIEHFEKIFNAPKTDAAICGFPQSLLFVERWPSG